MTESARSYRSLWRIAAGSVACGLTAAFLVTPVNAEDINQQVSQASDDLARADAKVAASLDRLDAAQSKLPQARQRLAKAQNELVQAQERKAAADKKVAAPAIPKPWEVTVIRGEASSTHAFPQAAESRPSNDASKDQK